MAQNKKGTLLKDAFALFAITLIAGFLLGFVYEVTKQPIADAKAKEKRDAYTKVFATANDFLDKDEKYLEVSKSSSDLLEKEAGIKGVTINEVLDAYASDGSIIGYVMTVTSSEGYGGDVPITIGITLEGKITGIELLANSETSGFGSKAKEPWFKDQFKDLEADQVSPGVNFDGISGATITTKAITKAINGALYYAKHNTSE